MVEACVDHASIKVISVHFKLRIFSEDLSEKCRITDHNAFWGHFSLKSLAKDAFSNLKYQSLALTTQHWPHATSEWSWYIKALRKVNHPITDHVPVGDRDLQLE